MALFGLQRERKVSPFGAATAAPVAPVHHVPLSPRELRAQAVYRLQVGLFGLGAILLLISLANVIMERVTLANRAAALDPTVEASSTAANDPLVDMGVAPNRWAPPRPRNRPTLRNTERPRGRFHAPRLGQVWSGKTRDGQRLIPGLARESTGKSTSEMAVIRKPAGFQGFQDETYHEHWFG
jgi:hypothetical protein